MVSTITHSAFNTTRGMLMVAHSAQSVHRSEVCFIDRRQASTASPYMQFSAEFLLFKVQVCRLMLIFIGLGYSQKNINSHLTVITGIVSPGSSMRSSLTIRTREEVK